MKRLKLYHGSNLSIDHIDLSKSNRGKDFGCGFYLNPNEYEAKEMAQAKADFLGGEPIVTAFEFMPQEEGKEEVKIKIFDDYTEDWAEFVALNRRNRTNVQAHDYDIVIGPIADDKVGVQIRRYVNGYISTQKLIEELKFKEKSVQYFFGTERSLKLLKKIIL